MIPLQAWQSVVGGDSAVELKPGVWRIGDRILKRSTPLGSADPRARLLQYCEILAHLEQSGIPVSVPVVTDDEQCFSEYGGELYTLSAYVPGSVGGDSSGQLEQTGVWIARLHQALAICATKIDSWEIRLGERVFDEAWPKLRAGLPRAEFDRLAEAIEPLRDGMLRAFDGLAGQRIHGDCHAGNILFEGDRLTGFIDLDHLPIGPRTYDLGYYLSCGITACTEGGEDPADALDRLSRPLLQGYRSVNAVTEAELSSILPIMLAVQLILADWYQQAGNEPRTARSLNFLHWASTLHWEP